MIPPEMGSSSASSNDDVSRRGLAQQQTVTIPTTPLFADTSGSAYYKGYQQAWRMLGIYVDCSGLVNNNNDQNDKNNDKNNNNNNGNKCQRHLLWAAYIDTLYQGGSIGEYQYYDSATDTWDDSACALTNSARCAKMNCHWSLADQQRDQQQQKPQQQATNDDEEDPDNGGSSSTSTGTATGYANWQLLGVYKEQYYASEWFEQLFKHAGYCLWNDNTAYSFMQTYYNAWPENGCVAIKSNNMNNNKYVYYYVDLAPGPTMNLTLYTDSTCFTEVVNADMSSTSIAGTTMTLEEQDALLQSAGYLTSTMQSQFNAYLSRFSTCQPCRAFNLANTNNNGNNNDNNNNGNDGNDDPNYPAFACYDDAGYTNVNQCMKFRTHTTLQPASWHDIQVATLQGAIPQGLDWATATTADGGTATGTTTTRGANGFWSSSSMSSSQSYSSSMTSWKWLSGSVVAFALSLGIAWRTVAWKLGNTEDDTRRRRRRRRRRNNKGEDDDSFSARFAQRLTGGGGRNSNNASPTTSSSNGKPVKNQKLSEPLGAWKTSAREHQQQDLNKSHETYRSESTASF